ncbi:hypothetical protein EDD18DRAFT_1110260 [Armillaria luteobubalina]|uniref:Uncharacterized protein n=1 Tax=Armillaria luteobubalina TaxID=153913 RepID=A0AA39PQQ3_9AGAR|nr:hypothetical protein EDD18DRAFT_1110260 [Armillaria luteobubalina]
MAISGLGSTSRGAACRVQRDSAAHEDRSTTEFLLFTGGYSKSGETGAAKEVPHLALVCPQIIFVRLTRLPRINKTPEYQLSKLRVLVQDTRVHGVERILTVQARSVEAEDGSVPYRTPIAWHDTSQVDADGGRDSVLGLWTWMDIDRGSVGGHFEGGTDIQLVCLHNHVHTIQTHTREQQPHQILHHQPQAKISDMHLIPPRVRPTDKNRSRVRVIRGDEVVLQRNRSQVMTQREALI